MNDRGGRAANVRTPLGRTSASVSDETRPQAPQHLALLEMPAAPASDITEAEFEALIIGWPRRPGLALLFGWHCYHARDSRGTWGEGYPDWTLAKEGYPRLLLWELKTERGRLSADQREWGRVLERVPGVEYRVVRPSSWLYVVTTLTAPGGAGG